MLVTQKNKIPLLFLIAISISWTFIYQTSNVLNDYGTNNEEWLYLIDGLIILPVLCWFCIDDKKESLLKIAAYSCLVILIGSFIIPEQNKVVWNYLESLRYVFLVGFVLLEVSTFITIYLSVKNSLGNDEDPDLAIAKPIEKVIGKGILSSLLVFETRIWTYMLFPSKIKTDNYIGVQHFSYHNKDGCKSNSLGFILIILFEIPVAHILLHFIWSPLAANVITALTAFSLVLFTAEYRALSKRPISLTHDSLIIRYGIRNIKVIPLSSIEVVDTNSMFIKRASGVLRYNLSGNPNVLIHLKENVGQKIKSIYIGVDNPQQFIAQLNTQIQHYD